MGIIKPGWHNPKNPRTQKPKKKTQKSGQNINIERNYFGNFEKCDKIYTAYRFAVKWFSNFSFHIRQNSASMIEALPRRIYSSQLHI